MSGVINVKDGSTWKCLNFSSQKIWVKHSSTWKEPTAVYVKHSSTWKKVYPSDLTTDTASNFGTSAARETASNAPNLSTDGAYIYTNILGPANEEVRWSGVGSGGNEGQYVRTWGFGWSPSLSAGFSYGAITRLKVTLEAQVKLGSIGAGDSYQIRVKPQKGSAKDSANLTTSNAVYTFDYTVSSWGLSDADAGALHLDPNTVNSIQVRAVYDHTGSDVEVSIEDCKALLTYKYN